ncbi:lipase 1-like [Bicyclus anynana]|uniref:Lipase n=1 Tax=Bicyclus anynana TaxID=110368 RepID=A0A6J1NTK9_BICAN|nr:lipase 1-like [Bicyclus anynana]
MWTSPGLWLAATFIISQQICGISTGDLSDDRTLNSILLATKYGHPPTQYDVVTEDGYILAVYRLPGKGRIPVLLVHGFMDSSDTFLIRGNTSLAIYLANKGYDVWLANTRGNRYSRRHKTLNPDKDPAFWQFSFHEMGYYDLPAVIDTILNETGAKNVTAIGHSQGNTIFYVLGSERKEYNSKINVLLALAPIAFLQNVQGPLGTVIKSEPVISGLIKTVRVNELLGDNTALGIALHSTCSVPVLGYTKCAYGLIFPFVGSDPTELEPDFFQNVAKRFPAGGSGQSLLHFLQVGHRKKFAQYDYGSATNKKIYNSSEPPLYRLDRVTMLVALYAAANDGFSTVADVDLLRQLLAKVVYYLLNPLPLCNHADYVWGRTANVYLYPYLDIILNIYNRL